ncbi:tripartite tricarboxylate transporter permease [Orrella daihaiensis]|uniref:Tripartite tricarboxylate transporter permease n=1 Tax=Orrella daihaiensis TaxID=2782176 RepID=A0ABY4APL3_9BURK|nr:tripartite tricarboxylate transporter permease [Orrella daihaiensis]UOD49999.1 tripartite tricarboxylate transporter permease [Orrella daihaiensis]
MEIINSLLIGFDAAIQPTVLLYCFLGVFLGTFVGVLPGIGPLAAISLLLPITYYIDATSAIVMLAGVYYGAEYGGSTASILLNLPGTTANAVTCLDGHPMAKQGRAGVALFMTTIASLVGGVVGIMALVLFSHAIVEMAMQFGPAEYFALMVLGLIAASTLASGSPAKGMAMVVLGLLLGTVGTDINSGTVRFDFGIPKLMDGISLVVIAMGLFGISEIVNSITVKRDNKVTQKITMRSMMPTREDVKASLMPMSRGAGIGGFFGALPGTGAAISAFIAYAVEKKIAKDPTRFGNGAIEGITAPESANNAAAQSAFIPTLTLGIPGSATMAIMLGALIIHGIEPGPLLMSEQPSLFWGLIVSFFIGNIMLLVLNIPLIGLWVSILNIPYRLLYPAILVFIAIGVYSVSNSPFDILLVAIVGILGVVLSALRFQAAPLLLGFVLGPLMEENLRRALLISRGDLMVFVDRPISLGLLVIASIIVLWSAFGVLRRFARRQVLERERAQVDG